MFRALAERAEHLVARRRKRAGRAAALSPAPGRARGTRRTAAPTIVERAGDEREKRAAGRMRAARAALEVHRHAGALERVLEQAGIVLRRAERDRHAIERHAAARLAQDPARDFDRLAAFARRREQLDLVERIGRRRHRFGEQVAADAVETGGLAAIEHRWRRQRASASRVVASPAGIVTSASGARAIERVERTRARRHSYRRRRAG